jgi:hypothetical protein
MLDFELSNPQEGTSDIALTVIDRDEVCSGKKRA